MPRYIDVFNHYLPQEFYDEVIALGGNVHMLTRARNMRAMWDLSYRLKKMQTFDAYAQIPCIVSPNVEQVVPAQHTARLARLANECFYRLCQTHPQQFPSFVATLPLDDMQKACREAEYAVTQLGAAGVQVFTNQNGAPIDSDAFYTLYETLNQLNCGLWVHPARTFQEPYYKTESLEKYELWWTMLWPIETGMAAARLAYSGIGQRCPNVKVILHHGGGILPMLEGRLQNGLQLYGTRTAPEFAQLTESPIAEKTQIDEFKRFYVDCATFGSQSAIECAMQLFGADHLLFASDMPFDPEDGFGYVRRTLADIERLPVSQTVKQQIYAGNACNIFSLS